MTALPDLNALPLSSLFHELSKGGLVRRLLELARDEDLGTPGDSARGDITSAAWLPREHSARASLVAREPGVLSGGAVLPMLIELFAPRCRAMVHLADGAPLDRGSTIAIIDGPLAEILRLERTMLNLLSRLSGIATLTSRYVGAIGEGTRASLFDTRKTTPGLRVLEKYAVRCGGGSCHRLGLHDAVLIKDNHIAGIPPGELPERLAEAAARARADRPLRFVEIEADSLDQFELFLAAPRGTIDVVLLDNMPPASLARAVQRRDAVMPNLLLEASGGITLDTIRDVALSGVDRISSGAITHSARSIDLALDIA